MLNSVRVELRSFGGAMVAAAFTSGDGNFDFENVAQGSYMLVVEQMGYQSSSQRVDVNGSVVGVSVDLQKLTGPAGTSAKGSATISARELSIPHKAHDAMVKAEPALREVRLFRKPQAVPAGHREVSRLL